MPEVDLLPLLGVRRSRAAVAAWIITVLLLILAATAVLTFGPWRPFSQKTHVVVADHSTRAVTVGENDQVDAPEAQVVREPIEGWLADLAREAGQGLLLGPGIAGAEVTAVFAPDTEWRRRLGAVARLHGLEVRHEDGFLEVSKAAQEPPPGSRVSAEEADSISTVPRPDAHRPPPPRLRNATRLVRLSHARASDLITALDKPLSSGGITAGFDAGTNSLVLGGPEAQLDDAVRLAEGLDIPRRRFLLEAHIVELSRSARHEMGVQWTLESNDLGAIVNFPTADGDGDGSSSILVATSGSHSLRARLSALESKGRVRVISRPRIVVVEGKPASIEAVRILRVRLPDQGAVVADADASVSVDAGRAFEEIPVGVTLQVEPSLQGEGNIVLRIVAKSSTLGPPQPPDNIPEELSRRVEADVVVADGHTAVLGGMLRETSSRSGTGVPVLRSIPLLGALFGRKSRERDVEELIVLVTPRLIS
jgi:type II secretory pathway component HofQ